MNDKLLAADYNCTDSQNGSYGAGSYSTCDAATSGIGAPNTGDFLEKTTGIQAGILLPALIVVIITITGVALIIRRKKLKQAAVQLPANDKLSDKE